MHRIAAIWGRIQGSLFPHLEAALDAPLTAHQRQLVAILEVVRIEECVPADSRPHKVGRKPKDRVAIARAFVAKAVYNLPFTETLWELLCTDPVLRQLCGFTCRSQVPSTSTLSRAFAEFAATGLPDRVHAALVQQHLGEQLVGHVSRDATDIPAREKPVRRAKAPKPKGRPGRPKKGQPSSRVPTRLEQQRAQEPAVALAQLPQACDVGMKLDPHQGRRMHWTGYKLHLDVSDACLPLLAVTTAASVHDSQAAIPMARLTAGRVTALYELMDSGYEAELIEQTCRELGHVPLIPRSRRRRPGPGFDPAQRVRFRERTVVERAIARLKDEFGGSQVRVRGHAKVHCHLMFGLIVLFADQLLKLVT